MFQRLPLALLLLAFTACIDGSPQVNVGVVKGDPDATRSTVEVVPATGVPADGQATARVIVTVRDRNGRVLPGQAVSFTATGSDNRLSQPPMTGDTGMGEGSIASTRAETKTVTVTVGAGDKAVELVQRPEVEFVPGNGALILFTTQPPASVRAGDTFQPFVQLRVVDGQGNLVTTPASVTLTLEQASSGATLEGTTTKASAGGLVGFDDLKVKRAGTGYTLRASGPGLVTAVSTPFSVTAGPVDPTRTLVQVSKSSVVADGTDSTMVTITTRDAFDNPVAAQPVSVTSTGAGNTVMPASGNSGIDGVFTAELTSTTAELKTVQVSVSTAPVPPQPQVSFVHGPPARLAFVVHPPAQTVAGQAMAPAVALQVLDTHGNRATAATINTTLALEPAASGATLGGTTTKAMAGGLVSFGDLSVQKAGTGYTLRATAPGLSDAVSAPFNVTAGVPTLTTSSLAVAPASVVADNVAEATITVTVKDAYGNAVSGQTMSVSVSGMGNTLDRTSGLSGANGQFVAKLRSTTAEVKSVDATAASLTLPPASVTFVAGAVAKLSLTAVPTEVEANGTDETMLTAVAEDAFGNRVPNVAITFTAPGTGNVFTPGDGDTDGNGQRITTLRSSSSGVKTVNATGDGKVGAAIVTFLRPAPQVSGVTVPVTPLSGCATLQYTLSQPQSVRANVAVEYELGGVFRRATQAGSDTDSGVQGVATSPTGVTHVFHWNSTADLPASNATLRLRVTAQVPGSLATSFILDNVTVANGLHFAAPGLLPTGTAPSQVARADLNGDGRTDVVVSSAVSNDLQVLLGDGAGSFGAPSAVTVGVGSSALLVRDLDGDGKADALVGSASGSEVYLLKGTGSGTFGAPSVAMTLQGTAEGLAAGDLDRDGKMDLTATSSAGTVEVALATAPGVFGAPTRINVGGSPKALAVSDLNLDARLDLVFVDPAQDVKSMLGTGSGTFGAVSPLGAGTNVSAISVTDLNRDARPDVVAAQSSGAVRVVRGNGDGTFSAQSPISTGGVPMGLAVADMDADGNRDVVVTGAGGDVFVLGGQSDGSLHSTPLKVSAGGPTAAVVVLDADRSGRPDIVTARPADNGLAVLLNTEVDRCESALAASLQLTVSTQPSAAALSDLDGDGRPELIVAAGGSNSLNVARGRGNGTFASFTSVALGTGATNPQGVTAGDFNGDGRVDLVSANQNTGNVTLLLDDGAGGYTRSSWSTGSSPRGLAAADFDEDGKLDLVIANSGAGSVTVLYGNGDGTFPVNQTHNVGMGPQAVVVADFSGDGRLDIATANTTAGSVTSLRNNGGRAFTATGSYLVGSSPRSIAVGDFTGDNKPDLVVANSSSNSVTVLPGQGDGSFATGVTTAATVTSPEFREPRGVAVGDFDMDGQLDVATGNFLGNSITLLLGQGDGRFEIGSSVTAGTGLTSLVGADVDGDGRQDLVASITADNRVSVLRGVGAGVGGASLFPVLTTAGTAAARSITVADMNKDGKPDLLTSNLTASSMSLLLGDGVGGFAPPVVTTVGGNANALAVGDVNSDGNPDVVVAKATNASFSILMGDGNGGLTAAPERNSISPKAALLEDLNADGALDIVSAGTSVLVHLNNGSGTFSAASSFNAGGQTQALVVADFNRDGKPDVASANSSSTSTLGVLLGNGAGGLTLPAKTLGLGSNAQAIAAGDLDQDGKVDVVLAIGTAPNFELRALKGVGDGTFMAMVSLPFTAAAPGTDGVAVGDLDGDGRLDLAAVLQATDSVLVWRGNGAGGFSGPVLWASADVAQSVAFGDINGDGLLDIVTGGSSQVGVLPGR